ncbi:MAG: NAD-dependent epimerase/dehydratase family protein, partial [Gammaproteobacteria bacterium]
MSQPTSAPPSLPFNRILLTGAAGRLGSMLRQHIQPWTRVLRLSDVEDLGRAGPHEELVSCDLADRAGVLAMLDGVDAVLHFGGVPYEGPFEPIMQANILGMVNLYEAVHKLGIR